MDKNTTLVSPPQKPTSDDVEKSKILEIIHIASNILSGGFLGVIAVAIFLLHTQPSAHVKKVAYEIVNFNLSFVIWFILGYMSLFILIGFVILPILYLLWFVFMVIGALKHIAGDTYEYPMSIQFLK